MWKKTLTQRAYDAAKAQHASRLTPRELFSWLDTVPNGLTEADAERRIDEFGRNEVTREQRKGALAMFVGAFINPFIGVLTMLVMVSFVIDVWLAEPSEQDWTAVVIITTMVVLSAAMRFVQERRATLSSEALQKMVTNTCSVRRRGHDNGEEIDIALLVPGDVVKLSAGDMVPADIRIIDAKDLFVSQSSLTGESEPIEKTPNATTAGGSILDLDNLCFMGSTVVSGTALGVVFATGDNTYLRTIAQSIAGHRAVTAFDRGVSRVSILLVRFMLVMVPVVFLINGLTKGDWFDAFIFAVSVAVGLTPEMLPMIVTANLSKGAVAMSRKKTIVKDINAIQNFGAMDVLCTDKTGTLTQDRVVLERYVNADGHEDVDKRVLRHAYFNSYFQTGLKNLIDKAVLAHADELDFQHISQLYTKVDEIPFDFTRRRMSVVIESKSGKRQIVTKGAVEEMLEACAFTEREGVVVPLCQEQKRRAQDIAHTLNRQGLRVLAVAHKSFLDKEHGFAVSDEADMVLIGFLAFLDPPKPSAATAIRQLHEGGVKVKILSGDNDAVVQTIAMQVGVDITHAVTGPDFEAMTDEQKRHIVGSANVFSKLTPMQKTEIISLLQQEGDTVGFLGDGINDAAALRQSDIGISVDTAVDIAKESADIILLEKDLMVLEDGVIEGRKIFGNITKYIKMTASSNFGNVFSVIVASIFLPFLPMLPVQLLVQNLLYDVSQTSIPFDRMDASFLKKPRRWDASDLSRFMVCIGPISSVFDIATYLVMWYVFKCTSPEAQTLFQSGWFVEGLLSQTLIVYMIRTRRVPFLQSNPSWQVFLLTGIIVCVGIALPFTTLGSFIGLQPLPLSYFPWLVGILLSYCLLTQGVKNLYIRHFGKWL